MLVSGTPAFRGGGGISDSKLCGRDADSVMRGRFDDCRTGWNEEKEARCAFRHREHILGAVV